MKIWYVIMDKMQFMALAWIVSKMALLERSNVEEYYSLKKIVGRISLEMCDFFKMWFCF